IRPEPAPIAVSLAVCMATQMWQPFLTAIVSTTTSRATGSSAAFSKIPFSFMNPSSRCGDAAILAIPAGRYPRCSRVAVMVRRASAGADSIVCSTNTSLTEGSPSPYYGQLRCRSMSSDGYGYELPLLLFGGFRSIIDELHAELARRGHPQVRPAHGFALQAIGLGGATASEAGRRLGISKQAAGKTIDRLEELGYVHRSGDDADRRRKLARLTPRGVEVLALSAMIFNDIRSRWAGTLGTGRLAELEAALRTMAPGETFRLDVPGWFG